MNKLIAKNLAKVQKRYLGKAVDVTKVVKALGFTIEDSKADLEFEITADDVLGSQSCSMNNCAGVRSIYRIYAQLVDFVFIGPKYSYIVMKSKPTVAIRFTVPQRFFVWKAGFDFMARTGLSQSAKLELKNLLAKEVQDGKAKFTMLPPSLSHRSSYKKAKLQAKKTFSSGPSGKRTKVSFIAGGAKNGLRGKYKSQQAFRILTLAA